MSFKRCTAIIYLFLSISVKEINCAQAQPLPPAKIKWQKISTGLEISAYNPDVDSIFSQELMFIRASLSHYMPAILSEDGFKLHSAKEFCLNSNSSLCVNVNFFDEKEKPLGLVIKNGRTLNPMHKGGSVLNGIFSFENNKISIKPRDQFNGTNVLNALQTGPLLLQNGKVYSKFKSGDVESRRAGACVDYKGRLIIFCSLGDVTGPSFNNLIRILQMPAFNCNNAINFDGGGSAQLYINEKFVNMEKYKATGKYSVPVALALINK
jgi:uncharacterized protein YigE (DUF2233 family)